MRCLVIFLFLGLISPAYSEYLYVPFEQSMYNIYNDLGQSERQEFDLFKKYYEQRNPAVTQCTQGSIPKIIHQIWVGPKPIPEKYIKLGETWKKLHPDWEYKLWRDEDIKDWDFGSKDLYEKASSYQERADVLRYEILNKYGGIYVDTDYEALQNFDELASKYDFFASIEPVFDNYIAVTSAIIGSKPHNKILTDTIRDVREHWDQVEDDFRKNKANLRRGQRDLIHLDVNRVMTPLKYAIKNNLAAEECTIVFPTTYMSIENRPKFFDKIRNFLGLTSKRLYYRTIQPETMARQLRGSKRDIVDLAQIF